MMHLFVNMATNPAVQEMDCLAISGIVRTKILFNVYTMIFRIEGCLLVSAKKPALVILILWLVEGTSVVQKRSITY